MPLPRKWKLYAVLAIIPLAAFGIYRKATMAKTPIGALCGGDTVCDGECLGFGDLLPDYSHKQVCTQTCEGPSDCPAPTTCQKTQIISSDGKGTKTEEKSYCLPPAAESK